MGNGTENNPYRTLLSQIVKIGSFVLDGQRKIEDVTRFLQVVIASVDFVKVLDAPMQVTKKVVVKFLAFVGTITVPALTETWNALDRFKKDLSDEARVKIYDVGSNFIAWFGKMVVGAHTGSTLGYHTLTKRMSDKDIIAELGGEANVEVTLTEVWWLMEQQKNGGNGVLLNDGKANIFYIRDCNRVLRALLVRWFDGGWVVDADEFDVNYWYGDRRVFSRNSIPAA